MAGGNDLLIGLCTLRVFRKKTQKTPESEIKQAIKLKEEYYGTKGNQ